MAPAAVIDLISMFKVGFGPFVQKVALIWKNQTSVSEKKIKKIDKL